MLLMRDQKLVNSPAACDEIGQGSCSNRVNDTKKVGFISEMNLMNKLTEKLPEKSPSLLRVHILWFALPEDMNLDSHCFPIVQTLIGEYMQLFEV